MAKEYNGYRVVELEGLKDLNLVRIVNAQTNRCVGTCAPEVAEEFCNSLPSAGAVPEVTPPPVPKPAKPAKSSTKPATKSADQTPKPAKPETRKPKNDAVGDTDVKNVPLSTLITALKLEYQESHAGEEWLVPVECCIAENGVIFNKLNNPSDRKTRTLSDEEIAMLKFTPDGNVKLCKEYLHSDGTTAAVDKEGLSFVFDMDKVAEGEKSGEFPLYLLRKGGGNSLLKAWHVQDPATYADKSRAIVYDLETTGVKPDENGNEPEILQLTIMDFNGKALVNEYYKPENITDWSDAAAVNGITADLVANCPTFRSRLPEIQKIFDNATLVVGYNSAHFDDNIIKKWGVVFNDAPHYDVMVHYQKVFGMHGFAFCGNGNKYLMQKLTLAYLDCIGNREGAKETVLGAHDALNDTRMTLELFYALQTNDLVRDTPHWISLFLREVVRNKNHAFGTQEEATKIWTDMFYLPPAKRIDAIKEAAGKNGFGTTPKTWNLAPFCKIP